MSWAAPASFVWGVLALTTLGAMLPLEAGRRQEHIVVTVTATAQLAILGPPGLVLVWAAVAAGLVLSWVARGRGRRRGQRRDAGRAREPGRHQSLWLVITATAVTVGFSLAYLVHAVLLGRDFPLDVSTSGRAGEAYLVMVVAWLGTMSVRLAAHRTVSRAGVADRLGHGLGAGSGTGSVTGDAFDPFDSALLPYLLPTVGGAPVVVAAVAVYDPGDPWLSLAVLLWCLPLYAACRFELYQRRLGQRLRREAEARRRLAAIGEVSARVIHQSRHHAGLMGWSLHRLRRLVGDPSPDGVRAVQDELDQLAAAKRRLQDSLEVELLVDDPGAGGSASSSSAPAMALDERDGSLATVVREVVDELEERARHRGVTVACHSAEAAGAVAGPPVLRDALFNVVDNAIDAATRQVSVSVSVSVDRDPPGARVTVTDDGPGLPDAVGDRAFEPFVTTKPDGTGMGLPIAEAILTELGGGLVHEPDAAATTFVLTVPAPTVAGA
jgi:hypothetical protein